MPLQLPLFALPEDDESSSYEQDAFLLRLETWNRRVVSDSFSIVKGPSPLNQYFHTKTIERLQTSWIAFTLNYMRHVLVFLSDMDDKDLESLYLVQYKRLHELAQQLIEVRTKQIRRKNVNDVPQQWKNKSTERSGPPIELVVCDTPLSPQWRKKRSNEKILGSVSKIGGSPSKSLIKSSTGLQVLACSV